MSDSNRNNDKSNNDNSNSNSSNNKSNSNNNNKFNSNNNQQQLRDSIPSSMSGGNPPTKTFLENLSELFSNCDV